MSAPIRLVTFGGLSVAREGAPAEGAGAQRRRLALLALLAVAGDRGLSREKLLSLLWPESDLERARKNLAQAVYALRRDLGADELVLGTTELRLNSDVVTSDLDDFRRALREGRHSEAVDLYRGPFLDGIYLDEAPEFERWAETERNALAHDYVAALERLAREASEGHDSRRAVGYWRLLANADPLNAESALGLMRALVTAGDRAAALQHFRVYEMLLRQDLDLSPDAKVQRYADELREMKDTPTPAADPRPSDRDRAPFGSASARPGGEGVLQGPSVRPSSSPRPLPDIPLTTVPGTPAMSRAAPVPEPSGRKHISGYTDEYARPRPQPEPKAAGGTAVPPYRPTAKPFFKRTSSRLGILLGLGIGLIIAAFVWFGGRGRVGVGAGGAVPIVAVGVIKDYTRSRDGVARPLADLLATDLARDASLQVISTARMYELMAQAGIKDSSASAVRAARDAGATELLDGALYVRPDGRYRLDLTRTNLATGGVVQTYSADAADIFALVESARRSILGAADSTVANIGDVTTRSLVAYRFYEEGLRAILAGDQVSGGRLMQQAMDEDSTFAMAAYWLATTRGGFNDPGLIRGLEQAVRLSARASLRERLTILAAWAAATDHPSRIAVAESLTVRFPNEPDGYNWLASARISAGDFQGAIAPLRRVIRLDSLSLGLDPNAPGPPVRCSACQAYADLIFTYELMDSLPAAVQAARAFAAAAPRRGFPAGQVSWALMLMGRYPEALAADREVIARDPSTPRDWFLAQVGLRTGDFAVPDSYYVRLARGASPSEAGKWLSISKRIQGRPREAMDWARRLRALEPTFPKGAAPYNALFEAQCWYELGDYRHAAALFDSVSRSPRDTTLSQRARNLAWTQLLRSSALAAAGDTAPLGAIADSLEAWGRLNSYGRDGRSHHHVRGLLLEARGDLQGAEREFRAAVYSPTGGYTRTNIELAKLLLRLDRPREAAYWADAGLRGGLDASQTYVSRSDLLELSALAWDAAGQPDSAATRYRQVLKNWGDAEPVYRARVERARIRLSQLEEAKH